MKTNGNVFTERTYFQTKTVTKDPIAAMTGKFPLAVHGPRQFPLSTFLFCFVEGSKDEAWKERRTLMSEALMGKNGLLCNC